jgi:hypothetical protein
MYKDFTKKELVKRVEQQDARYKQMVIREHELVTELIITNELLDTATETLNNIITKLNTTQKTVNNY